MRNMEYTNYTHKPMEVNINIHDEYGGIKH